MNAECSVSFPAFDKVVVRRALHFLGEQRNQIHFSSGPNTQVAQPICEQRLRNTVFDRQLYDIRAALFKLRLVGGRQATFQRSNHFQPAGRELLQCGTHVPQP